MPLHTSVVARALYGDRCIAAASVCATPYSYIIVLGNSRMPTLSVSASHAKCIAAGYHKLRMLWAQILRTQ